MVSLYALKIDENIDDKILKQLQEIISYENQIKVDKFKFKKDKIRTLFGELLLRYVLKVHYHFDHEIKILRDEYQKPHLEKNPFYFNISHSGQYVVCAIDDQEVGVDIEEVTNIDMIIAKQFFDINEYEYLMQLNDQPLKQKEAFFKIWTVKESYVKLLKKGLQIPLNSFRVDLYQNKIINQNNIYFKIYEFDNHQCSICTYQQNFDQIKFQTIDQIIEQFI